MNTFHLSRNLFTWSFEHPDIIKPGHVALYFFIIDHANHLGWPMRFGIPLDFASAAIGIKKMQTVSDYLKDLEKHGFIKIVTKSLNQHTANIIEIVATPKNGKALGKARGNADGEPKGKATVRHRAYNKTDKPKTDEHMVTAPVNSLLEWLDNNCPRVQKMKEPITNEQAIDLVGKYPKVTLARTFEAMQNYTKLSNNISANLTVRKWIERDQTKNPTQKTEGSEIIPYHLRG